ncbi:hypothetical protein CgunFtcFv8_014914 [Champsocephalus gunnari]|uniref:Uncharacterized protein n=2 Tax=Champsocephalus gunnari TaxID=52237 RepID=A0AAN8E4B5_CHAGU|nr:hypothetical protein CgunFtcFv8_014914 [Champsocephalus gunnari]
MSTMLAPFQSGGMISVWQMDPMSLARDSADDFYSSSAESQGRVQNVDMTRFSVLLVEANGTVMRIDHGAADRGARYSTGGEVKT